jgi:hypothetical protein
MTLGMFAHRLVLDGRPGRLHLRGALFGSTYLLPVFMQEALPLAALAGRGGAAARRASPWR